MIDRFFSYIHLAPEGKYILGVVLCFGIILGVLFPRSIFLTGIIFLILLNFFRDPVRKNNSSDLAILSAADGVVTDIEKVSLPEYDNKTFTRIGVFLSVFNVHVQRIPFSGEVILVKYKQGKHYPAFKKDVGVDNESNLVLISTSQGIIGVKQISGLLARKVKCSLVNQNKVVKGGRLGIILFGSRVEVFLPDNVEIIVKIGDKVQGVKTVLANFINK